MITAQEIKKYLSSLFYLSLRLQGDAEQVAQYRSRAMKTTTWIERAIVAQERAKNTAAELLHREEIARELLELLDGERERAILEDYHLHRLNVQKIAAKYHYSERQIIRIRKKAYYKLSEEINKRPELIERIQAERGTNGKDSTNKDEQ